jgi:hypothetical protein
LPVCFPGALLVQALHPASREFQRTVKKDILPLDLKFSRSMRKMAP